MEKIKYYRIINNKWTETIYQKGDREVKLYNNNLEFYGIGLY